MAMNNYTRHVLASKAERLTADYKTRNPDYPTHKGMDFVDETGECVITAIAGGIVDNCRNDVAGVDHTYNTAGNYVRVRHPNGAYTRYLHLKQGTVCVRAGQSVREGDKLGIMGNTGDSYGTHIHFDVYTGGGYVDPLPYLTGGKGFGTGDNPQVSDGNGGYPDLRKGDKVTLKNAPLYASSTTGKKSGTVTGDYYIHSDGIINGRIRVTTPKGCADCTGWVNASGCKGDNPQVPDGNGGYPDLRKGDKVTLKNAPLYASSTAGKKSGTVTGDYYIHSDGIINGRIRVTTSKGCADCTGWVNAAGCKTDKSTPADKPAALKVGDRVRVKSGALTYSGGRLAGWVYDTVFDVQQAKSPDYIVIGLNGQVTAAVRAEDLAKA